MEYVIKGIIIYVVFFIILVHATKDRNDTVTDTEYQEFISYLDKCNKDKKKHHGEA